MFSLSQYLNGISQLKDLFVRVRSHVEWPHSQNVSRSHGVFLRLGSKKVRNDAWMLSIMLPIVTNCCQFPSFCSSISRNIAIFLCGTSLTTALFNWVIYVAQISSNISRAVGGLMNGLPFKPFMRKGCLPLDVSANYVILNHVCEITHKFQKTLIFWSATHIWTFLTFNSIWINTESELSESNLDMNLINSYLNTNWGFQKKRWSPVVTDSIHTAWQSWTAAPWMSCSSWVSMRTQRRGRGKIRSGRFVVKVGWISERWPMFLLVGFFGLGTRFGWS